MDTDETRQMVAGRAEYICEACGQVVGYSDGELAHVIPQRKHMLAKYGKGVIHHPNNLRWTHPGKCNDAVSIGNNPHLTDKMAQEIRAYIYGQALYHIEQHPDWYTDVIDRLSEVADGQL